MPCRSNAGRSRRERLGRRVPLPRHGASGDRPLLDGPHRLAGHAVENVHEGLLARLGDGLDVAAVDADVDEVAGGSGSRSPRARGAPPGSARRAARSRRRRRRCSPANRLSPWRMPPYQSLVGVPVGRVDVSELLVDGHRAPHVGVAAVAPRFVVPRVGPELVPLGDGVEDPLHFAGAGRRRRGRGRGSASRRVSEVSCTMLPTMTVSPTTANGCEWVKRDRSMGRPRLPLRSTAPSAPKSA